MSEGRLRLAALALAAAGLAISTYLAITWYADEIPACVGGDGGCATVQTSDYADLGGVPVALLGAIGYALIGLCQLSRGDPARLAGALLALAGLGFSAYLTYLELFVIDAICQWCVASGVLMAALAAVCVARLLTAPDPS